MVQRLQWNVVTVIKPDIPIEKAERSLMLPTSEEKSSVSQLEIEKYPTNPLVSNKMSDLCPPMVHSEASSAKMYAQTGYFLFN